VKAAMRENGNLIQESAAMIDPVWSIASITEFDEVPRMSG
jgi:hypothetical protein